MDAGGTDGSLSLWNFLHGGTPHWTINFWYKMTTDPVDNMTILQNNTGDSTAGIYMRHYTAGDDEHGIRTAITKQGGNNQALTAQSAADFFLSDGNWHMYTFTCDFSLGSANYKIKRDYSDANESFNKSGSNTPEALSQNASYPLALFHHTTSGSGGSSYIPPPKEIMELSIWDRVLTDAEITKIYNSGNGMQLETGLKVFKEKGTA